MLASGKAPRIPQDKSLATYAPKLNRESGRINWNEPTGVIEHKIRAYNPWPGAFSEFENRKLKIFAATITDLRGKPGGETFTEPLIAIRTPNYVITPPLVRGFMREHQPSQEQFHVWITQAHGAALIR